MSLHVYRVVVRAWPTEDGLPWNRYYGYDWSGDPEDPGPDEPPPWVLERAGDALLAHRFRYDDEGNLIGVLMPRVSRKHYLSGTTARRLLAEMQAFGATALLQRSQPVAF